MKQSFYIVATPMAGKPGFKEVTSCLFGDITRVYSSSDSLKPVGFRACHTLLKAPSSRDGIQAAREKLSLEPLNLIFLVPRCEMPSGIPRNLVQKFRYIVRTGVIDDVERVWQRNS